MTASWFSGEAGKHGNGANAAPSKQVTWQENEEPGYAGVFRDANVDA
jgi:hypothetical protein